MQETKRRRVLSFDVSATELGDRLRNARDDEGLNRYVLARGLFVMKERRLYQLSGHANTEHFAEAQLDMLPRRVREYVQVGRAMHELELLDEAFRNGEISWSRVLVLLRVIQRETQSAWVAIAKRYSLRDLRDLRTEVFGCKPGQLPGEGSDYGLPCRKTEFTARLGDETLAMLEEARMKLSESPENPMDNEELIAALVRHWLHGDEKPKFRKQAAESREQAAKPREQAAELREQAAEPNREELDEDVRQQVLRRDHHRCRNCDGHMDIEVHHIVFRSRGGSNAPDNLVSLCKTCHALIHRKYLHLTGNPETGELTFFGESGNPIRRGDRSPNPITTPPAMPPYKCQAPGPIASSPRQPEVREASTTPRHPTIIRLQSD